MSSQNRIKRYIIFAKRLLYSFFRIFVNSGIEGMYNGPKIFANSIPKSGTFLLQRVLYNMPKMRFAGTRTLRKHLHSKNYIKKKISSLKNGQYQMAHVDYNSEIAKLIEENNIKSILIIRDPRQIIISHYKYVSYIDTTHPINDYFKSLKDDNERIMAVINGIPGIVEPIEDILNSYVGWMNDKNTLVVKFEDLIGEKGGGSDFSQHETIKNIYKHVDISLNISKIKEIANKVFDTKSPTFRSGNVKSWNSQFSEKHKRILKNKIGSWLIEYGYEEKLDW
tara:strand:- start:750 stop:1589 length:840 start_codon:yes stop_codon:yes gene_type:complete